MYTVKVKKLDDKAVVPFNAYEGDAGFDLCSVEDKVLEPHGYCGVRTGISIELPAHTEGQVRPRSGLALKHGVTVLNGPGTVDEAYRGEICVILINHSNEPFRIECGMKVAQLVVKPTYPVRFEEAAELTETSRGENGFGSSGAMAKKQRPSG